MSAKVRVRFAPSPTGPLHIGGVRTALYNYLFAKKHKGDFVLRIEDTDQNRYVDGAEDYIVESLNWCGIPYDEGPGKEGDYGPYRQSERKDIYRKYAEELLKKGQAYYAFDTAEELDAHRKDHEEKGKTFIYNWHNRMKLQNSLALSEDEVRDKLDADEHYVIRFKSPEDENLHIKDEIRGEMEIDTSTLDDKVLFKSDGMPTYHLANIVDDHLMEISHVIRGEEWLPSLALHFMLYRAFGWDAPKFAHLPLILKPQGKGKLSKRDGDKLGFPVFPLEWKDPKSGEISAGYREDGYFPEAVTNMLAFLGWNPGTEQEFFKLNELVEAFEIDRVHKGGAKFDPEKTKWFQQHYMHEADDKVVAKKLEKIIEEKEIKVSSEYVLKVVTLMKERAVFVNDIWDQGYFFFLAPTSYDPKNAKKAWKDDTGDLIQELIQVLEKKEDFKAENVQAEVKAWIQQKEVGFGKVMQPFRLALVGAMQGPDLYEIAEMIGKEETISRLEKAIKTLG
ncbi:glutamate--tRNA ligase [Salegentibacter mishustinae]|uniref:Glutamate--tRNA ligase n=1 Tax=Salegentibacter mishustinae TaxID=270918 RepID=A0A0Q9ZCE0_9FLAO|nr:glutamate--tRNA ligase [Salegentibacter mishustinae]KRG29897.1 glutamate--tRNA ligase [Salegentibacter mishustinae]PNW20693.1 glutamate--tRNA ligase [Salegentibacter mishustinae]PZX61708.1 glutamyl-tRNA synthetase [Salegentibacter mishustinae]